MGWFASHTLRITKSDVHNSTNYCAMYVINIYIIDKYGRPRVGTPRHTEIGGSEPSEYWVRKGVKRGGRTAF